MKKETLLTVSQAARKKGVTRTTIYNAIASKRLKAFEVLGRTAIKESELMASDVGAGKSGPPPGKPLSAKHRAALRKAYQQRRSRRER
jgi:excisionase family DNA binding protein